jgi:hypothetical protein
VTLAKRLGIDEEEVRRLHDQHTARDCHAAHSLSKRSAAAAFSALNFRTVLVSLREPATVATLKVNHSRKQGRALAILQFQALNDAANAENGHSRGNEARMLESPNAERVLSLE